MLMMIFLSLGLWAIFRKQVGCIKDYCERPSEDESDSINSYVNQDQLQNPQRPSEDESASINTDVNQDQLQNAQSFGSEWDDSKDSDRDSFEDVYQVCKDP
ncbi:uncharacterized protein Hap1MRO34_009148 [Clarias gariepinus]